MTAHTLVVCLLVGFVFSVGGNLVQIVLFKRRGAALRRMRALVRKYRGFHVRRIRCSRSAESTLFVDLASARDKIEALERTLRRTASVFRKYRKFHVRRIEETLKSCRQERSLFLKQWKIFAPKAEELGILCEYWEAETHHWRKRCWWLSDKAARERDREVVRAATESAAMHGVATVFSD